jgi:hypothetical protein
MRIEAPDATRIGEFMGKWIVVLFFAGLFYLGATAMGSVLYAVGGWSSVVVWIIALLMWEIIDISGKLGRIATATEAMAKDKSS